MYTLGEPLQKKRKGLGARRNMPAHLHPALAQLAGNDSLPFAGLGIRDPQQFLRHPLTELPMQPEEILGACCFILQIVLIIDKPLHLDMGDRLVLQSPFLRVGE